MKRVLLFPGQGSQTIGMGRALYDAFLEARAVFEEVDDALSQSLSRLIFDGSAEELNATTNAQPALMAVSLAVIRVLEKAGLSVPHFTFAAGHSLGEYTALSATGAITLSDAAQLLRQRGHAMQQAVPLGQGGMVAVIGGALEDVQALCRDASAYGIIEIANDNCPGQVVLSGETPAVNQVPELAKKYPIRTCIPLAVSAPFHSSLMQPAAEQMSTVLQKAHVKAPYIPVISNVSVRPEMDPDQIKALLVQQMTSPVRWRETLVFLDQEGVEAFYEIGAGRVLAGLVKRTLPNHPVSSIHSPEDIDQLIHHFQTIKEI